MLGNDTVHNLNSDLFENLGVIYEQNNKDVLIYYKKDLKLKMNFYGEIMMKQFNCNNNKTKK